MGGSVDSWAQALIPLGGFGLLIFLLLQNKLIHPTTLTALLAEKDKQIARAEATATEWKEAYRASEQARQAEHDAREVAERRADAAVEAAQLIADGLDKLRERLDPNPPPEGNRGVRAAPQRPAPQRRVDRGETAG
jgi:F0F1-type ATP synthase membrane subunit b/b'